MHKLLEPRFIVLCNYINSQYNIGDIIIELNSYTPVRYIVGRVDKYNSFELEYEQMKEYPALFRELNWWENRKLDEMPDYVKVNSELLLSGVFKVVEKGEFSNKDTLNKIASIYYCNISKKDGAIMNGNFNYSHFEPATEAEYNDFIKLNIPKFPLDIIVNERQENICPLCGSTQARYSLMGWYGELVCHNSECVRSK